MRFVALFSLMLAAAACPLPCLALSPSAGPRHASVKWIEKDFDFGLMKEIAGPKTGTSRFVNLGPDTLSVFNVRPSCGCTSADFFDGPIAPGDTAFISYTYNPEMRPGKFDKSVKVILSDGSRHTIRITGNVLGTPESLATLYPVDAGDIRLSEVAVNAGEVPFGRTPVAFVNAYSLSLDSISPLVSSPAKGLVITPSDLPAGPGDIITYTLTFDSRAFGQYGPVEIPISFAAHGGDAVSIPFRAYVVPDTDALIRMQQGKTPACEFTPDPIDLGEIAAGTPLEREFIISNPGSGPLRLFRILADSAAFSFGKIPETVKPGKRVKIKLRINPADLPDGPFRIPLTILSSDPLHTKSTLNVAGFKKN